MRSIRYLNTILTVMAVLLTLQLWTMWTAPAAVHGPTGEAAHQAFTPQAHAQLASALQQNKEIIDQLKQLNQRMQEQNRLLESGRLRVQVEALREEPKPAEREEPNNR